MRKTTREKKNGKPSSSAVHLRARIEELEETLLAIRGGQVDALVIRGANGDQVFTLQGAEHPYRVLVESINEGAATLDTEGTILYANSRFADILDARLEAFIGTPLQSHVGETEGPSVKRLIAEALVGSTAGEINLGGIDGARRLVRLSLSKIRETGLAVICVIATELTELANANDALKASEEALRQLSGRLMQLQDDERRDIARDLHDITGQKLAVQSISLSRVLNSKTASLDADARNLLTECAALTHQVSEEIRTLSYLLHPPLLDELGLASAIKWYTQGFESRTKIQVEVDIPREFVRLLPDAEVALFRVVQESLTNVHRYSGSNRAFVRLAMNHGKITLQIGDSGKGIPPDAVKSGRTGVGIQGMKERMRQLSGNLEITRRPKGGTVVTATLSLSDNGSVAQDSTGIAATPAPATGEGPRAADSVHPGSCKRILIADDHEMLRRGVRTLLQSETEIEICGEAVDGKEAVEKANALNPDLVILDINMPILNGLVAVRQILRNSPRTKILVFTVHESDQMVREIIAAGAHGYLSKGKGGRDLLNVVKDLLKSDSPQPPRVASAAV